MPEVGNIPPRNRPGDGLKREVLAITGNEGESTIYHVIQSFQILL